MSWLKNKVIRSETAILAKIAFPLALAQLLRIGIALTNTYFISRLGMDQLSGASLAIQCFTLISAFINGLLSIIGVQIAYDKGKNDSIAQARTLSDAFYFCLLLAFLFSAFLCITPQLLVFFNQPEISIAYARVYVVPLIFATLPNVLWMALRYFLSVEIRTSYIVYCNLFGLAVNYCGNYFLSERLGIFGVALSTTVTYWLVLIVSLLFLFRDLRFRLYLPDWQRIIYFVKLGLPVSSSALCDTGFFTAIAFIIGQFGAISLSSHHLALQFLYIPYVIPYSYSIATSLRIAYYQGTNELANLDLIAKIGIISALIPIVLSSIVYSLFPTAVLAYFQNGSPDEISIRLIFLVSIMQIFNAVQVVMMGALRGVKDTKIPFYMNAFSYWMLGIPASIYLSNSLGPSGVWFGMILAQACLAICLISRWSRCRLLNMPIEA